MKKEKNLVAGSVTVLFIIALVVGISWAEYPERSINMIVGYAPGGNTDLSARALAKVAEKQLGQPIAVLNKPGAGATLAVGAVAAAKPDGYTIGVITFAPLTMAPHMYDVPYNPLTDFEFIMGYGKSVHGLCVRSDSPFKTLKDLVDYAKANPGKIKYSIPALATPNNFAMIYLAKATGAKWEGVIFKGGQEATTACLGGHVDAVSMNPLDMVPYIKAGRLRLLASFDDERWEWVPEVPTARELGYDFVAVAWFAVGAPKGTPKPILEKLRAVFKSAIDDDEFRNLMKRLYFPVVYRSPEEHKKLVEDGYKENEKVILELGLHRSQKKGK